MTTFTPNKILAKLSAFALLFLAPALLIPNSAKADIKISYFALSQGRLAFTYTEDEKRSIQVLDFATLDVTPLVSDSGKDDFPAWSPDGAKLAFQSARSGKLAIYTVNADGSDLKQLTNSGGEDQEPSWSPDGKKIVFRSNRGSPGQFSLFVMNADGSAQTAITGSHKIHLTPKWSPKGNEILFVTTENWPGSDLATVDLAAKRVSILSMGSRSFLRPAWDPTATQYAYSFGSSADLDIWVQKRAEAKGAALITRPGKDFDPEWNDDGTKLFFAGETEEGNGHYEVYVFNLPSQELSPVTQSTGSIRNLSWTVHSKPVAAAPAPEGAASPTIVAPAATPAVASTPGSSSSPAPTQAPAAKEGAK